jgi:serine/threonine protein kinase
MNPGSIILTQEGMVFGTPEFMSPEQAQGKNLDARSDIYSLAVILYEALTGKLPFDAKTPMEFIQHHVASKPIDLNDRLPGQSFPPELAAAIAKAIEKKPENRFQSAAEFALALQPIVPEATFEPGVLPSTPTVAPTFPTLPMVVVKSNTSLILGVALGSLVLGVILAIVVMKYVLM